MEPSLNPRQGKVKSRVVASFLLTYGCYAEKAGSIPNELLRRPPSLIVLGPPEAACFGLEG